MPTPERSPSAFSVKNLTCLRQDRLLFRGLNFSLNPGEVLHVHGANGVGKSSLLRILCGLLEPAAGEVWWQGQLSSADPVGFRRAVGYLGHKLGLKERLTVAENVDVLLEPSRDATSKAATLAVRQQRVSQALARLGVLNLKDHLCDTLSAGQKQRVALARLLARDCALWLLDEPFTAIDQVGIGALEALIQEHVQGGGLVVLTSHQPLKLTGLTLQTLQL